MPIHRKSKQRSIRQRAKLQRETHNNNQIAPTTQLDSDTDYSIDYILQLQSMIGNQAVMRMMSNSAGESAKANDSVFLQRMASGNVIQRDGDGPDQYTVLKQQADDVLRRKLSIKEEIANLQIAHDNEKDRKKRRTIRVRMSKLSRKEARLQYRFDNLIEEMKPLYKQRGTEDKFLEDQIGERNQELTNLSSSSPVENAKQALEEERKRKQAEEDKKYKTYAELEALSLTELKKYITETPNWHKRSTHTPEQIKTIQDIHALTIEPGALASLGGFTVTSLVSESGTMADKLASLRNLVKAVKDDDPFPISAPPDMATAMKKATALKKLKAGFPNYVLNSALVKEKIFDWLIQYNMVDEVVKYYTTASAKPIFQADNGADFVSYLQMRVVDSKDPLSYDGTVLQGKIRSFHRFEAAALDQLIMNFGEKGVRPLTLILHSAIDHNGAFHRDPKMTAVIKNANINALMIEGGETLADYRSQITPLAQEYGVAGMLDQVMFAGHGGSQIIEMAGTVKAGRKGKLEQVDNPIDLRNDKSEADKIFDEVLKNMDVPYADDFIGPQLPTQKNRRILFNACLTNSNAVEKALSGDIGKAKAEIADYLKNNASLATYLGERAKSQGRDVKSLGANASITQFDMIESSGELTMESTVDPKVAASKLEYAEEGHEPLGTLRAALESWASDDAATIQAMQRRIAWGSTGWDDTIIEKAYKLVLKYQHNGVANMLDVFITAAHDISSLKNESHANVVAGINIVKTLPNFLVDELFAKLEGADEFSTRHYLPLILYQLWMWHYPNETALHEDLLLQLKDHFDVKTGRKYIHTEYLKVNNLIGPMLTGGGSTSGKLILSLINVLDSDEAKSKKYLKGKLSLGAPEVPGLPEVPEVPAVPEQDPPRGKVEKVPEVPGRAKVEAIADKRTEVPEVPKLPELPELPAVSADASGKAPGREKREKREAVPKVPAVDKYFHKKWKISQLLSGTATEQEIVDKVK